MRPDELDVYLSQMLSTVKYNKHMFILPWPNSTSDMPINLTIYFNAMFDHPSARWINCNYYITNIQYIFNFVIFLRISTTYMLAQKRFEISDIQAEFQVTNEQLWQLPYIILFLNEISFKLAVRT